MTIWTERGGLSENVVKKVWKSEMSCQNCFQLSQISQKLLVVRRLSDRFRKARLLPVEQMAANGLAGRRKFSTT